MAYPKYKYIYQYEHKYEWSDIVIYNLITNKIDNLIYNAQSGIINSLKHYYNSFTKCHFLLSISNWYNASNNYSIFLNYGK